MQRILNVWILSPYGPLPGSGWRDHRTTLIAKALSSRGHRVTRWVSTFDHNGKAFYNYPGNRFEVDSNFAVRLIDSKAYQKNISLDRVLSEIQFGKGFERESAGEENPDVLVVIDPALFYGSSIQSVVKRTGCKLIVDVVDAWPELFAYVLPKSIRRFEKLLFAPLYWERRKLWRSADGMISVCAAYMEIIERNLRPQKFEKETLYIGVDQTLLRPPEVCPRPDLATRLSGDSSLKAVYAGSLGQHYDIDTLLQVGEEIDRQGYDIKIFIAGHGPEKHRVEASQSKSIEYLGLLNSEELSWVYSRCDVGLCTYSKESTVSFPVKAFDYLAAGLIVVSSLGGDLKKVLDESAAGIDYVGGSRDSLTAVLTELCNDRQKVAEMKANSLRKGSEFDIAPIYAKYNAFTERIASSG